MACKDEGNPFRFPVPAHTCSILSARRPANIRARFRLICRCLEPWTQKKMPTALRMFILALILITPESRSQSVLPVSPPEASFNPAEVSIAVNPLQPQNIVVSALTDLGNSVTFVSADGGQTWATQFSDNPDRRRQGDDAVAFSADGVVHHSYIAFLGLLNPGAPRHASGIFVATSRDGGRNWEAPVAVVDHPDSVEPFEDKPYLVSDTSNASPHQGNLYVSWTRFDAYKSTDANCRSHIFMARLVDGGRVFGTPIQVSDVGGDCLDSDGTLQGAVPAVGPHGELYVAWASPGGLMFDRSLDGGSGFGTDRMIAANPGGWDLPIPGLTRHNGMPVTAVDLSPGPFQGSLYVNWIDERNGDTDVFLIHSRDGGDTWSLPLRVNDDLVQNGLSQFFTWMAVDPVDGSVNIAFYDRRETSGNEARLTLARSTDGGNSFVNLPIDLPPFECSQSLFFGDYSGIDAHDGKVYPVFMHCPSPHRLAVSMARFDFSQPEKLTAVDDPGVFQADRSIVFDFEGFEPNSPARRLLTAWGIELLSSGEVDSGSPEIAAILSDGVPDNVLRVPSLETSEAAIMVLDFDSPVRRIGFDAGTDPIRQLEMSAFDWTGQFLGAVQAPESGRFFGAGSVDASAIRKVIVKAVPGEGIELDDLRVEFFEPPEFESCLAQIGNGRNGDFRLSTVIQFANPWNFPVEGTLRLFDDAGSELPVEFNGAIDSEFFVQVAPFGSVTMNSGGDPLAVGFACLSSAAPLQATASFQLSGPEGGVIHEAGVESASSQHLLVTGVTQDTASGLGSGVAIANPSALPVKVELNLRDERGNEFHTALNLPPVGHAARFLDEFFPALQGIDVQGALRITSAGPIVVTALRTMLGRLLSSLPVAGTAENSHRTR